MFYKENIKFVGYNVAIDSEIWNVRYTDYINNTCIYLCDLCPYFLVSFSFCSWNTRFPARFLPYTSTSQRSIATSVVVVDDVSPLVRTGDVDRIRYRGWGVVISPKTQHSIFFVCCVGDVHGKSQEVPRVSNLYLKNNDQENTQYLPKQSKVIL